MVSAYVHQHKAPSVGEERKFCVSGVSPVEWGAISLSLLLSCAQYRILLAHHARQAGIYCSDIAQQFLTFRLPVTAGGLRNDAVSQMHERWFQRGMTRRRECIARSLFSAVDRCGITTVLCGVRLTSFVLRGLENKRLTAATGKLLP